MVDASINADVLIKELVRAEYIRYKAYVDAYKIDQGHEPNRNWIHIRITMSEAEAFLAADRP